MRNKTIALAVMAILSSAFLSSCGDDPQPSPSTDTKTVVSEPAQQHTEAPAEAIDASLLAFGAIVLPAEHIDELNMGKAYDEANVQSVLAHNWDVTDAATAKKQLDWLVNKGHRSEPNIMMLLDDGIDEEADVIAYRRAMVDTLGFSEEEAKNFKNIDAWDIERIAVIARYSYLAGFLTAKEASQYLETARKMAQDRYGSWSEYAVSFLTGRALSFGNTPIDLIGNIKTLMTDPNSIWNKNSEIWTK
ncbi:DUF1266 domain-containing protein [Neisseria sp. Ec49-e6-T10]|uniref:DUF1266 domain-containing protein n=1 Tax=Neisseria sp. Ec49-e6-T10 TaxID=3140744 RepID=UPI003EBAF824